MPITLEQIKAIQPLIKQGNSADDRTWTLNGQPVYQIPLKDGTPAFVPASIYQEIQANPSAYPDIVKVAPPELLAANDTPAFLNIYGYMPSAKYGLPHAMEGAPAPGVMDSLLDTAGTLVPYALAAGVGGLASGMISSGGAAAGATGAAGMGAAGGAYGAVGSSGMPSWLTSLFPSPTSGGVGAADGFTAMEAANAGMAAPMSGGPGFSDFLTSLGDGPASAAITDTAAAAAGGTGMGAAGGAMGALGGGSSIAQTISAATGIPVNYLDAAGKLLPGVIGAIGANSQSSALSDLANKFDSYGAPSRARYEASMTAGFDPTTIPGYSGALDTASQSILRGISAREGNPFGTPGGLIEANKSIVSGTALPAIQNYQNQNANTGGLGALAASYPSAATNAVNSNANVWNALGGAAADVFSPQQTSLADLLKQFKYVGA